MVPRKRHRVTERVASSTSWPRIREATRKTRRDALHVRRWGVLDDIRRGDIQTYIELLVSHNQQEPSYRPQGLFIMVAPITRRVHRSKCERDKALHALLSKFFPYSLSIDSHTPLRHVVIR